MCKAAEEASKPLGKDWQFIDVKTAANSFRIERAAETKHFLIDICERELFVVTGGAGQGGAGEGDLQLEGGELESGQQRCAAETSPGFHIQIPVHQVYCHARIEIFIPSKRS